MENEEEKLPEELANAEQKATDTPLLQTSASVVSTSEPNVLETEIPMTSERISSDGNAATAKRHPNDVRFKVKYSKNFEGEKNFEDGSIQVVSKESGEHFAKLGMGSIIK
jgi:hypothetical protein